MESITVNITIEIGDLNEECLNNTNDVVCEFFGDVSLLGQSCTCDTAVTSADKGFMVLILL